LRRERNITVIVTTHYIEEVEGCDRVCVIDHGRILAQDAPAALKAAHGRKIIRVMARDESTAADIAAAYPDVAVRNGTEIVLDSKDGADADAFLSRYGSRIRSFAVEEPSLESVFLSLTGRELRDQAAGARERTYEFGKRGGEHTR
jgi:ABC-2 type transport system ATP-binding protein